MGSLFSRSHAATVQTTPNGLEHSDFLPHERKLMHQFLPDFVFDKPSTLQDLVIVTCHWAKLNLFDGEQSCVVDAAYHSSPPLPSSVTSPYDHPPIVLFFDTFYQELFELAPHAKMVFRFSLQCQSQALMHIVEGVKSLLLCEDVAGRAYEIARTHVSYGVKCEYFNPVGLALMKSLEEVSPQLWTKPVQDAWRIVFGHVAVLLLSSEQKALHQRKSLTRSSQVDISIASESTISDRSQASSRRSSKSDKPGAEEILDPAVPSNTSTNQKQTTTSSSPVKHAVGSISTRRLEIKKHAKPHHEESNQMPPGTTCNDISHAIAHVDGHAPANGFESPFKGRRLSLLSAVAPEPVTKNLKTTSILPDHSRPEHLGDQQEDSK